MKYFVILFAIAGISLASISPNVKTSIAGKITNSGTGEPLIGATIKVLNGTELVRGGISDYDGNYTLELDPGVYTVEVNYTGFATRRYTDVKVEFEKRTELSVEMEATVLCEVVVKEYKVGLIEHSAKSESEAKKRGGGLFKMRSEPASMEPAPSAAPKPGTSSIDGGAIHVKGSRSDKTSYYIDGVRTEDAPSAEKPTMVGDDEYVITFEAETYEEKVVRKSDLAKESMMEPAKDGDPVFEAKPSPEPRPKAGLLTAGEWNDLHNWVSHWVDINADGEIDQYKNMYQFFPEHRFSLMLTNTQDYPLVDVPVALLDAAGSVVWEGRTDNTGTAELWAGMFDAEWKTQAMSARVFYKGKTISINNLKSFDKGINKKQIKTACGASQKVDIMWAVDATGSMGDELEYLKSELLDVIGRVQAINPDLSIRIGSAFYRDKGDEYIVKSSGLSSNITQTVEYIKKQAANGGGDYPEAVHSALEEAILNQNWEDEAVTRICFLVLDASPHQEPEVIESLHKSIREAARKGIRIVPVSASGVQKDTEFLMKFFGLATNGSYVFLTDHSGIGGKHLAPTTDEYKVEQLNDLLVRIITEYSTVVDCNGKTAIRFEDQQQNNQEPLEQALYYPNPSSTQFTLELPFDVEKVTLYNSEGQAVKNYTELRQGRHTVVVNDLPAGFYTLRIWKDGRVQSGKVLVAHS